MNNNNNKNSIYETFYQFRRDLQKRRCRGYCKYSCCKCCCCNCPGNETPGTPEANDTVFLPIGKQQIPTETSGGLFSFVAVQAYYLPGAETQRNGNDRFAEDMRNVSQNWGFPIVRSSAPIVLTANDLGANFSLPTTLSNLVYDNPSFRRLQEIHENRATPKIIAVWYAPFSGDTTDGEIGTAFSNVGFPNQQSTSQFYQHIVIRNRANDGNNNSTLQHELGHIFFHTATGPDNTPLNNGCDPTSPLCTNTPNQNNPAANHSPLSNNLMHSPSGNSFNLTDSQRVKASSTFLFL